MAYFVAAIISTPTSYTYCANTADAFCCSHNLPHLYHPCASLVTSHNSTELQTTILQYYQLITTTSVSQHVMPLIQPYYSTTNSQLHQLPTTTSVGQHVLPSIQQYYQWPTTTSVSLHVLPSIQQASIQPRAIVLPMANYHQCELARTTFDITVLPMPNGQLPLL